jgi:hypothetical protein
MIIIIWHICSCFVPLANIILADSEAWSCSVCLKILLILDFGGVVLFLT